MKTIQINHTDQLKALIHANRVALGLTPTESDTMQHLISFMSVKTWKCFPKQQQLADLRSIKLRTINGHIKKIKAKCEQWFTVKPRHSVHKAAGQTQIQNDYIIDLNRLCAFLGLKIPATKKATHHNTNQVQDPIREEPIRARSVFKQRANSLKEALFNQRVLKRTRNVQPEALQRAQKDVNREAMKLNAPKRIEALRELQRLIYDS